MAASSGCSEYKSRVIEPRNIVIAGAFVFMPAGAALEGQKPNAVVRPGSESRVNVRKVPWKLERASCLLFGVARTREDTGTTTSRHTGGDLATGVSKQAKHEKVSRAERNEAIETDKGSRSVSIVASESRETDPRKPVSSQGRRRVTELPLGNTR